MGWCYCWYLLLLTHISIIFGVLQLVIGSCQQPSSGFSEPGGQDRCSTAASCHALPCEGWHWGHCGPWHCRFNCTNARCQHVEIVPWSHRWTLETRLPSKCKGRTQGLYWDRRAMEIQKKQRNIAQTVPELWIQHGLVWGEMLSLTVTMSIF